PPPHRHPTPPAAPVRSSPSRSDHSWQPPPPPTRRSSDLPARRWTMRNLQTSYTWCAIQPCSSCCTPPACAYRNERGSSCMTSTLHGRPFACLAKVTEKESFL